MHLPKPLIHAAYALCAFNCSSAQANLPAREIARRMNVPQEQAAKILQELASAGLIVATRGRRGGYRLGRPLTEITLATLAAILGYDDGEFEIRASACVRDQTHACYALEGLRRVQRRLWAVIQEETLANLLGGRCAGPLAAVDAAWTAEALLSAPVSATRPESGAAWEFSCVPAADLSLVEPSPAARADVGAPQQAASAACADVPAGELLATSS